MFRVPTAGGSPSARAVGTFRVPTSGGSPSARAAGTFRGPTKGGSPSARAIGTFRVQKTAIGILKLDANGGLKPTGLQVTGLIAGRYCSRQSSGLPTVYYAVMPTTP
ncbi:hypothetical protein RB620_06440 [Paenibacillus sp. LHD-117]|uniref:hypothetical protein n=1 Tax=Paenibacillus sp. LHD-117 TaxID=3071412 RepID=UPI0027DF1AFC|nr:hypothetical protein [Paenibacillus sp. LHD-117]MDQ6419074.1 hypothetical protein [Paenibacillus sp. LHD-117]